MGGEMRDRIRDRSLPFEAQVAVARLDRQARDLRRLQPGPVQVEPGVAEPVGEADRRGTASAPSTSRWNAVDRSQADT
jgi:hypothetical protein